MRDDDIISANMPDEARTADLADDAQSLARPAPSDAAQAPGERHPPEHQPTGTDARGEAPRGDLPDTDSPVGGP